jgi:hypothetical protein
MSDVQANKLSTLWFVKFSVDSQLPDLTYDQYHGD